MHYSDVSACPSFYPFGLPLWLFLCDTCLDSEPLHFASKSVEVLPASLYHWFLTNKLTLDLSRYLWKSLVGDTFCCNFFSHC